METRLINLRSPDHVLIGMGALEMLGEEVKGFDADRALLVTDKGAVKAGIPDKVQAQLDAASIAVDIFDGVVSDPDIACAEACIETAKAGSYDMIVGVGGGSAMDIASATSVMCTNPGRVHDYLGIGLVKKPGIPTVLIPTTAGTGAEMTPNSILSDTEANLKKAIVSPFILAKLAVVDPLLTQTMPPEITSSSGIDALTHAIECYTSNKANPLSDLLAEEAILRIGRSLRTAVADGSNLEARYDMSLASHYAGITITLAGTTAVHALAYPLGGTFHVAHGIANGLLLPYVMEFNATGSVPRFAKVARLLGEKVDHLSTLDQARHAAAAVKSLYKDLKIPQSLNALGIPKDAIANMAKAAVQVTRLMDNNPRQMKAEDAEKIYEKAF